MTIIQCPLLALDVSEGTIMNYQAKWRSHDLYQANSELYDGSAQVTLFIIV